MMKIERSWDLDPLVFHGSDRADGSPRVLLELGDCRRVVVVIHESDNVVIRSLETDQDDVILAKAGAPAVGEYRDGGRFEAFEVNRTPYRFHWYTLPGDETGDYIDRLDGASNYTESAASKIRGICVEVLALVKKSRPGLFLIADEAAKRRALVRSDEELAKLAAKIAEELDKRRSLGQVEELPRISFEEGRAVLELDGVEATLAKRKDRVRVGLDGQLGNVRLRMNEWEGRLPT